MLRGAQNLSDAELVAILLRTGKKGKSVIEIARELVEKHGGLSALAGKSVEAIMKESGIGKDKAATLSAAFELSRRISASKKLFKDIRIISPSDIYDIFGPILRDELKEKFFVVCLNSANKIIKSELVSIGSLNASIVHPREVFKVAIDNNAASIILLHNHPSGNPDPSNEDISISKKLVEAGKLLDINVFDHIIIAGDTYSSMVERRII
jgi:DNA repair protein RadC